MKLGPILAAFFCILISNTSFSQVNIKVNQVSFSENSVNNSFNASPDSFENQSAECNQHLPVLKKKNRTWRNIAIASGVW